MFRIIFTFWVWVLGCHCGWSQDRIVTVNFDTIVCKVIEVKDYSVVYISNNSRRPEHMGISEVLIIERNVTDEITRLKERRIDAEKFDRKKTKGLVVGIAGGYGHMLGRVDLSSEFDDYVRQLRGGFNFGLDLTYFFGKFFGTGIRYNLFHTWASQSNVIGFNPVTGIPFSGTISDNIHAHSIGATIVGRFMTANRAFAFLPNISVGYLRWNNRAVAGTPVKILIEAIYFGSSFDFDLRIARRLFLGANFGIVTAGSSSVEYSDGMFSRVAQLNESERFSMLRLDVGLSLRYHL